MQLPIIGDTGSNPTTNPKKSTQKSATLDFFRTVSFDCAGNSAIPGAIGYALQQLGFALAGAFFGYACGMLATRLVINITKTYNSSQTRFLDELSEKAWKFLRENPAVRIACALFAMIIASFSLKAAFVLGAFLGVAGALAIDIESASKEQKVNDAIASGNGVGDLIRQWV